MTDTYPNFPKEKWLQDIYLYAYSYTYAYTKTMLALKGGEGSGNFGHAGRPGEVGGSGDGGGVQKDASKVTLYQGRGITGLPLANEDGYVYATTNRNLAKEYAGVNEDFYPNRDVPERVYTMRGEIRTIDFQTNNPLVVDAKETHGNRDLEKVIIEKAKTDGYDSVIFHGSAGGDTYVTWDVSKTSLNKSETDPKYSTYHPDLSN